MSRGLLIVGAGGHGQVVAEAAKLMGRWEPIAFLDDRHPALQMNGSWPVLGTAEQALEFLHTYPDLAVAIGENERRVRLLRKFAKLGFNLPCIVHPSAALSESAKVEAGTVILAQSAINVGAVIGWGGIINTGATVDHDCRLGEGVHMSPGAHLAGGVSVGRYSWIGIGAAVIQEISIGERVMVGAGAAVVRDVRDGTTVTGVPARQRARRK
jgi:sugar O-acyltransferase (sialic acid O-acetyltransferase NeuD family)